MSIDLDEVDFPLAGGSPQNKIDEIVNAGDRGRIFEV